MKLLNNKRKRMKKLLDNSLFNPVNIIHVHEHQNVTESDSAAQVKITPLYRVLFASYPNEVEKFTIITDDWKLKRGIMPDVCFKKVSKKYAETRPHSGKWLNNVSGGAYYKTNLKVNIPEFIKKLKEEKSIQWIDFIDYLADGTGEADERITEVMKSLVLELPLNQYRLWQAFNNHVIMITNGGTGKSISFGRLCKQEPLTDYSVPGIFGTVDMKSGEQIEGNLSGTGGFAFDEFPDQYDTKHKDIVKELLNYLANGETFRALAGRKIITRGCKAIGFFGNVPEMWDIQGFHKMLTKLAGTDALDRAGRRFGILLYGDNYHQITSSEYDSFLIKRIQFIIETIFNEKAKVINKILLKFKKWIEIEDTEYVAFFDNILPYVMEHNVKMFLKGFKNSWNRIKMAAVKKVILEHLTDLYTMKFKDLIVYLTPLIYEAYEQYKTYNYRSFEFLFHNKKHNVLELLKQGHCYETVLATGIQIPLPTFRRWEWEFKNT